MFCKLHPFLKLKQNNLNTPYNIHDNENIMCILINYKKNTKNEKYYQWLKSPFSAILI